MGRPPLEKKQRQFAVALPPDTRDQLQAAADVAGHSLAEEIRRRLNRTLYEDSFDEPTRELAAAVMWIAGEVNRQSLVPWHSNYFTHQALGAAILAWLEIIAPSVSGGASDLFGPGDPPTLGRSIARQYQRFKVEMAKSTAELLNNLRKGDKS